MIKKALPVDVGSALLSFFAFGPVRALVGGLQANSEFRCFGINSIGRPVEFQAHYSRWRISLRQIANLFNVRSCPWLSMIFRRLHNYYSPQVIGRVAGCQNWHPAVPHAFTRKQKALLPWAEA